MGRTQRRRHHRSLLKATIKSVESDALHTLYSKLHSQGWRNDTQLSGCHFPATGRGLCSKKQHFVPGDRLITMPVECLISIFTLESDESFKALFNVEHFDEDARISFQALVACYLMYQQHESSEKADTNSAAYLNTLPANYTTPYFCTIPELQLLPEALLERTVAQNRTIRNYYLILETLLGSKHCPNCNQCYFSDIWTLTDFRRAYFAVNTRSVYVESRHLKPTKCHFQALIAGDTNLALAPFLDLFNHSDAVETSAELKRTSDGKSWEFVLTLVSAPSDSIKPYCELFISYGALPNLKLLTEYGFFLERNAHDYFEFSLLDIEHLIKHNKELNTQNYHRNIFKFIRDHNLCDQMFVNLADGCSHNLRVVLHLIFKQQSYFPNVLNQIAFGDANKFDDVQPELSYLITYKLHEYEHYTAALAQLPELSDSGIVARSYLLECMRYLSDFEAAHCDLKLTDFE
ncbi:SET domain-containing protein 4 [Scaptodrosophila lebanonensis]|uniref:SET domain-containing protein 4 n=1 Tax=Drosophila lebanonensis TaxID=7225 RepID=A0A6J2TYU0_DROLE|nr:SET domain-containing protein 4 [Scaptodrosophila lebanonensis]